MSDGTYAIDAGQHNGTLDRLGIRHGRQSIQAAVNAIAQVMGLGSGHHLAMRSVIGSGKWQVYRDMDAMHRDDDGSHALATISAEDVP